MAEQKIKAILIVEIAGKPPEHVKESLIGHVENLKNFKRIKLVKYNAHEPKEIENIPDAKGIYSSFAEVEIEAENFISLMDLIFDFMPSSVEILEPASMNFDIQEATMILNRLAGRMHRYDEIAKIASIKSEQIEAQFNHIMQQLMTQKLQGEKKEIKEEEKKENSGEEKKEEEIKDGEKNN